MSAPWAGLVRRNAPAAAALLILLGFLAGHAATVRPLLARYRRDVGQAVALGMPLDGSAAPAAASARVQALLAANTLDAAAAEERGTSGALTGMLLDQATRLAAADRLEVRATEQGLVTQLPASVQVRAHLKLRGDYLAFLDFLRDLARADRLIAVDRLTMQGGAGSARDIDVWLSQLVLKRPRGSR